MIQAVGLTSHSRRDLPPAVDDLTFEALPGKVTVLLGPQRSGKTTALRLMLQLERGRGVALFRGRPLHRIPNPARELGVLLGDVPGHPARTARGHLRMLTAAAGVPADRADDILDVVGLSGLADQRLGEFSRGMDRRLGMAAALLGDPHTLVLDEPTSGVSPREAAWLYGLVRGFAAQGGTVLVTASDAKAAARTGDRIVTIEDGRLVADQEAEDFARTRLRPRVCVRSPHADRLATILVDEWQRANPAVEPQAGQALEVVRESGNRIAVYGSSCAVVGDAAFRHGILVHQLADEVGDTRSVVPLSRADGRAAVRPSPDVRVLADTGAEANGPAGPAAEYGQGAPDAGAPDARYEPVPTPAECGASTAAAEAVHEGERAKEGDEKRAEARGTGRGSEGEGAETRGARQRHVEPVWKDAGGHCAVVTWGVEDGAAPRTGQSADAREEDVRGHGVGADREGGRAARAGDAAATGDGVVTRGGATAGEDVGGHRPGAPAGSGRMTARGRALSVAVPGSGFTSALGLANASASAEMSAGSAGGPATDASREADVSSARHEDAEQVPVNPTGPSPSADDTPQSTTQPLPLVTEPPTTEPPVTESSIAELPAAEPLMTDPPITEPPIADPPLAGPSSQAAEGRRSSASQSRASTAQPLPSVAESSSPATARRPSAAQAQTSTTQPLPVVAESPSPEARKARSEAPADPAQPVSPINPKRLRSRIAPARSVISRAEGAGPAWPVRYEVRRVITDRTWAIVGAVVLVVSLLLAVVLARGGDVSAPRVSAGWPEQLPFPPAALGAGLIGALAFGQEFRYPALAPEQGSVPRRVRLLLAKLLVSAVCAAGLAVASAFLDVVTVGYAFGAQVLPNVTDWPLLLVGWAALLIGSAWAGLLAAGVFRSTAMGLAAVLAVPVVVLPLVQGAMSDPAARSMVGFPSRIRTAAVVQWPSGIGQLADFAWRLAAQPVVGAMTLSLAALLCAYALTVLRSKVR